MTDSRSRLAAVAAAVVIVLIAAVAVVRSGAQPPADKASRLVPADALVYVHASTDPDREQDTRMLARLERLPSFGRLRTALERAFGALDIDRDVRPWLGDEAAVAATRAGTMAVLAVADEAKAQGVLTRVAGARPASRYRGVLVRPFSGGAAAFVGDFLVVGARSLVRGAVDLQFGRGEPLSDLESYADRVAERPDDRVLDAWAGPGAAGLLLPSPFAALVGGRPLAADAAPTDGGGIRVSATRIGGASPVADFEPGLLDSIPRDAFAYVSVRGLRALAPLLPAAASQAAGGLASQLQPLFEVLDGQIAISIAPSAGDAAVTLSARPQDPARAREVLAELQGVIAALLTNSGEATGQLPVFEDRDLGGIDGFALTLAGGGELVYGVSAGRVAISNSEDAVRRALRPADGLGEAEAFKTAVPDFPESGQALAFLATSQLLELTDAAGLDASPVYRAVRPDLASLSALGAVVRRQGDDTTAELNLLP